MQLGSLMFCLENNQSIKLSICNDRILSLFLVPTNISVIKIEVRSLEFPIRELNLKKRSEKTRQNRRNYIL